MAYSLLLKCRNLKIPSPHLKYNKYVNHLQSSNFQNLSAELLTVCIVFTHAEKFSQVQWTPKRPL